MSNIQQNFSSTLYQYPQNVGYNVPSKGIEDIKKQDNMAGKVANTVDDGILGIMKRTGYGILMSMGFVHLGNWAMSTKNITPTMTQIDAYQASRLYQATSKLDRLGPVQWITNQFSALNKQLHRIPVPNFMKKIWKSIKVGTTSTWDKQGMYTLGKKAEAMKETVEFFSEIKPDKLRSLFPDKAKGDAFVALVNKVQSGKISAYKAFPQLDRMLKGVKASDLDRISLPRNWLSKGLGTTRNLNVSLSKARFFAGLNNSSGPFSKFLNKAFSLWTEASGGGVLGGGSCLFMNALGLTTAFYAAKNADKEDRFKAFMEDYLGFTIGGYVGSMFVGSWFNHFLGIGENGMRLNSKECQDAVRTLGLEAPDTVQAVVDAYNKEFKGANKLNKYLRKLSQNKVVDDGGIPIFGWIKRKFLGQVTTAEFEQQLKNLGISPAANTLPEMKKAAEQFVSTRGESYFKPLREKIASAMKVPDVKFSSIWKKGAPGLEGKTALLRFGDWFRQKPLATMAKLLGTGKYTLLKNGNSFGNSFRTLKRVGGGIGRIWLVGFILVEPFRNIAMKASHKMFGKPKKSQYDELNNKKQDEQKVQKFPSGNNQGMTQVPVNNQGQNIPSQNLVNLYAQNMPQYSVKAQQMQPQQMPVQNQQAQSPKKEQGLKADTASYIPNQVLGQESYIDPGVTQDLLQRRDNALTFADSAEKNAKEILSRL